MFGIRIVPIATLALLSAILPAAAGDKAAFRARTTFRTGVQPISVAIADVSRDGKLDLVVANAQANTVSVLYGRGDGTFLTKTDYPTGLYYDSVSSIAVLDVNHDGTPDILAFNDLAASFLAGNGGGTFRAPVVTGLTDGTSWSSGGTVYGDFNRDGKIDLITSPVELGYFLLPGNGRGGFGNYIGITAGSLGFPYGAFVGDIDGDGISDLITLSFDGMSYTIATQSGKGDGSFNGLAWSLNLGSDVVEDVKTADINLDGKPDLIFTRGNGVVVSLGRGDGTFPQQRYYPTGATPKSLVIADVNRDGKPDIITADYGSNTVSVLLGNGDGTFQPRQTFATGHGPSSLAVADVNADGRPDVIVTDSADNTVSVLLGSAP